MEPMEQRFEAARAMLVDRERPQNGIGTLGEKTLHAVLKYTFEPDAACHEQKVGSFVADIHNNDGITEIQTRGFTPLRRKLKYFLPLFPVHVVFPVAAAKYLRWIDPETGETTPRRKSPKQTPLCEATFEFIRILDCIGHENLRLTIVLLDVEETRVITGQNRFGKKASTRVERIPLRWVRTVELRTKEDYLQLLPEKLPEEFTLNDLKKAAKINQKRAQTALQFLRKLDIVENCGKTGRQLLYRKKI
ncbi:MAG: hypothetical protein IKU17_06415 [Clostridia bacterium]|nr:hypothetical protein [Clostridia bacterium]